MSVSEESSGEYPKNIIENLTRLSSSLTDLIPGKYAKVKLEDRFNEWGGVTDPIFQLAHNPSQNTNLHKQSEDLKSNYKIVLGTGKPNDYYLDKLKNLISTAHQNNNEIYLVF
jgi:hypothetical protein